MTQRYEELGPLGAGGFAEVVKARDQRLGREVALKRPLQELTSQVLAELEHEAQATSQLEHPCIPPLYEVGVDAEGRPYMCLQLVRGKSMQELIDLLASGDEALHQRFPFRERVAVFLKVCEAISFAHERGFYHRDIKPGNIMVGDLGQVFVLDWGLSKREGVASSDPQDDSASYFKGTLLYAPPERVAGEPAGARSDLYSLGATLYEWLTLHPVFEKKDSRGLLNAIFQEKPRELTRHNHPRQGRVPVELSRRVLATLAKEPAERPSSVRELTETLRQWMQGEVPPECPNTTVKYTFGALGRLLDNHPLVAMPIIVLWLLYPLLSLLQLVIDRFLLAP